MPKTIALGVWQGKISPTFDWCHELHIVSREDGGERWGRTEVIRHSDPRGRIDQLVENGVQVLICGAISNGLRDMLRSAGIELVSFIEGEREEVLEAYLAGELERKNLYLPGYRESLKQRCTSA